MSDHPQVEKHNGSEVPPLIEAGFRDHTFNHSSQQQQQGCKCCQGTGQACLSQGITKQHEIGDQINDGVDNEHHQDGNRQGKDRLAVE